MNRRKNKRKKNIVRVFLALFLLTFLLLGLFFIFLTTYKTVLINPLALKKTGQIVNISKSLINKNISFSKIEQNNDLSYKVFMKDNGVVFLSQKKDLLMQIDSLQLIANRLTIEGKRFKSLDFRFDKPVITY